MSFGIFFLGRGSRYIPDEHMPWAVCSFFLTSPVTHFIGYEWTIKLCPNQIKVVDICNFYILVLD